MTEPQTTPTAEPTRASSETTGSTPVPPETERAPDVQGPDVQGPDVQAEASAPQARTEAPDAAGGDDAPGTAPGPSVEDLVGPVLGDENESGSSAVVPVSPPRRESRGERQSLWKRIAIRRGVRRQTEALQSDALLERLDSVGQQLHTLDEQVAKAADRMEQRFTQFWEMEEQLGQLGEIQERLGDLAESQVKLADHVHATTKRVALLAGLVGLAALASIAAVALLLIRT